MENNQIVPFIPESAPFSPAQRGWLNGYIAGLCSRGHVNSNDLPEGYVQGKKTGNIYVGYGSQTGNAESASKKLSKRLKEVFPDTKLMPLDDLDLDGLSESATLVILTSTYGEGEPPDNAAGFVARLKSEEVSLSSGIRFSVFGFGDSSYPDFNACAKFIDEHLGKHGGTRLCSSVYADVDYESELERWTATVLNLMTSSSPPDVSDSLTTAKVINEISDEIPTSITKKNPFAARLVENYNLNSDHSSKCTHHISLEIDPQLLPYQPGDALGVIPRNSTIEIRNILSLSRLNPDEIISISGNQEVPLFQALTENFDIHNLRNECISALEKLDPNGPWTDNLSSYSKLRLVELLELTKVVIPTGHYLTSVLKTIQPRLYSISSSPEAHSGQVHVTVGMVNYLHGNFERKGLCSNYLKDQGKESSVNVYVHNNPIFKLPDDPTCDIIMIGPGTGIAPFRGFLHHRKTTGATGKNWLFFGDQRVEHDFLYHKEIDDFLDSGCLSRLHTAFSRDQTQKIYVQERLRENARELIDWLERGAILYVCGDASRMARDVEQALIEIVSGTLSKTMEQAQEYVSALKKQGRYLRDVY